ncbi:hypothetical protein BHF68_01215 [Desulfuribacillus alkaliarsenatis]|uniref:Prepilin leader peptidase/N-methyltransferase n=2 Tax=Desulfuribacillus alkaliarsenatis TaxID=766136 RepID=A0A1E5G6N3_9FIRM|nr:hypothetical protein BHF68_01215 [Desulfuribacillus alkaliarsenatis]
MALVYGYIFIIGAVIGSFLNVVIYRLPNEQSVIKPRSYCPFCETTLTWKQLIPVLSYIWQRGKCASCQAQISIRYPLIEVFTGIIFIIIFMITGFSWLTIIYWVLAACFIAIFIIDIEHMIIPDEINLFIFIIGIGTSLLGLTIPIIQALIGSLLGGGILWFLAVASRGGMGGGDIKFAFAIGLFTGWQQMMLLLFIASLIGCVYGLYQIVRYGYQKGKPIPFGPFLVIAAMLVLLWGNTFISYYFSLF